MPRGSLPGSSVINVAAPGPSRWADQMRLASESVQNNLLSATAKVASQDVTANNDQPTTSNARIELFIEIPSGRKEEATVHYLNSGHDAQRRGDHLSTYTL